MKDSPITLTPQMVTKGGTIILSVEATQILCGKIPHKAGDGEIRSGYTLNDYIKYVPRDSVELDMNSAATIGCILLQVRNKYEGRSLNLMVETSYAEVQIGELGLYFSGKNLAEALESALDKELK